MAKPTDNDWSDLTGIFNKGGFLKGVPYDRAFFYIGAHGASWVAPILTAKNEAGFVSIKLVALDFEEEGGRAPPSINDVIYFAITNDMTPLFYYKTFNHTEESPRFRLVFEMDEEITDIAVIKGILAYMIKLFDSDPKGSDASHFWAGGHDLLMASEHVMVSTVELTKKAYRHIAAERDKVKAAATDYVTNTNAKIELKSFTVLEERCLLWRHTMSGEYWCYYPELLHLAYSATKIKGGESRLIAAVNANPQYYNNRKHDISYYAKNIRSVGRMAHEERCEDGNCRYWKQCRHTGFITDKARIQNKTRYDIPERNHISLDDGSRILREEFQKAVESPVYGMQVVKASVGIGKSQLFVDYPWTLRVIIAFPTHALKEEIAQRFAMAGWAIAVQNEIEYAEADIKKMQTYKRAGVSYIARAISSVNNQHMFSGRHNLALATHDFVIENSCQLKDCYDLFVFDEDFTNKILRVETVGINALKSGLSDLLTYNLMGYDEYGSIMEWVKVIDQADQLDELPPLPQTSISTKQMLERMSDNLPEFNVWRLMERDAGIVKGGSYINYVEKRSLPDGKIVVTSATAERKPYEFLFGADLVGFHEVPPIELKGYVSFYNNGTYSHSHIEKIGVEAVMNDIVSNNPQFDKNEWYVIPAKAFFKDVAALGYKVEKEMFLGNTAGKDGLRGKNILILGKYSIPMSVVKSLALAVNPQKYQDGVGLSLLRRNGYEFPIYTFADEMLRMLHLWLMDSETIQCIGRARLIRENSSVIVAGLPVEL